MKKNTPRNLLTMLTLVAGIHQAAAQGSAFTYQGRLNDGSTPAIAIAKIDFRKEEGKFCLYFEEVCV